MSETNPIPNVKIGSNDQVRQTGPKAKPAAKNNSGQPYTPIVEPLEISIWGLILGGLGSNCGIPAEKVLNKPRKEDAGIADADDGGDIVPDGDDGVPDADGDGVPDVCANDPGVFSLSSPANESTGVAVTGALFNWNISDAIDPGDEITYTIIVADNETFDSPIINQEGIAENQYTSGVQFANGTTYYWKVIAKDLCDQETESSVFSFTTVEHCATPPDAFSLTLPSSGSSNISVTPTFDWADAIDPDLGDSVTYRLEIDPNNAFPAPATFSGIAESAYTLDPADALTNNTTYYWRVFAVDGCGNAVASSEVYSFTTIEHCATPPNAFSLTLPANGSSDISVTPTLDWNDAIDTDPDDPVTYRVEIDTTDTFPAPTTFSGIAQSIYTLGAGDALPNGVTRFWRAFAVDGCGNEVRSTQAYWSFTTELACMPQAYYDTDFTLGAPSNTVVDSGTITLMQDDTAWTCWDGSVDPVTVGWSEEAPLGWTINNSDGDILHLSSIDLNTNAYYRKDPSFTGSGWMVEARMQLDPVNGSQGGTGCAIDIKDGSHSVILRIQNNQVNEDGTGEFYVMDPTLDYNIYRIIKTGSTFSVDINGIPRLSGTAVGDLTASHLWFHDIGGTFDSDAFWDYICYYNGGNSLPYVANGTYTSEIVDTGSYNNNIGSGAMLHWSQTDPLPADSSIKIQFCASDNPDLSGANCVSDLQTNTGEIIPAGVEGRYFQWMATLGRGLNLHETPELFDVTLNYETCD